MYEYCTESMTTTFLFFASNSGLCHCSLSSSGNTEKGQNPLPGCSEDETKHVCENA